MKDNCSEIKKYYTETNAYKVLEELQEFLAYCDLEIFSHRFHLSQTKHYNISKWTKRLKFAYFIRENKEKINDNDVEHEIILRYKRECDYTNKETERLNEILENDSSDKDAHLVIIILLYN